MSTSNKSKLADGFSTKRLVVVHWDTEFADKRTKLGLTDDLTNLLTPPVLEHLPEPLQLQTDSNAVSYWISARQAEADVYTLRCQRTGRLLGLLILAGFSKGAAQTTIHIGYLFCETSWGQGLATEMLAGLVDWKLKGGQNTLLMGGIGKGNPASARVLEKAGFERSPEHSTADTDMFIKMLR